MYYPKSDKCILDWMFVQKTGLLERWQVFVVTDEHLSEYYQVFINQSLSAEMAIDINGRWIDLDMGYSEETDEKGDLIERFGE